MKTKMTLGLIITGLTIYSASSSTVNAVPCFCMPPAYGTACYNMGDKPSMDACKQACQSQSQKTNAQLTATATPPQYGGKCDVVKQ